MSLVVRTLEAQRRILAAMVVLVALVFWRDAFTVFSLPKATVVLAAVVGLTAWSALLVGRTRSAFVPAGPPIWAAVAFAGALVLATLTSPNRLGSLAGQGGRFTGLVMYGAYLLVFAYAARLYRHHAPVHIVQAAAVASVPVVAYGYLQLLGIDPLGWGFQEHGPPMFSTLGNPNFFSAWVAIVAVLCLAGALTRSLSAGWRTLCAVQGVACGLAAVLSQSLQGPVALAGGALFAGVALWTASGPLRRWRRPLTAGVLALGAGLAGLVLAGTGPFAVVRDAGLASYRSRAGKWEAAWAMFADRPLLGHGLDRYAERYWTFRPLEEAATRGLIRNVDAPHSVPLDMLASGGAVLGLAYVTVLAAIAWSIVVGLRRVDGDRRVLLAGFGGAWVAYQVQSLVSIDVPALAVLGWLFAGVVVALARTAPLREIVLPGAREPAEPSLVARAAFSLLTAAAVVLALWPLAADLVAGAARDAAQANRNTAALHGWARAAGMAPWDARYAAEHAHRVARTPSVDDALAAYERAWRREQSLFRALTPARVAADRGAVEQAAVWFTRALEVDGAKTPDVLREAGAFRLETGDADGALAVYGRAAELYAGDAEWMVGLERARQLTRP